MRIVKETIDKVYRYDDGGRLQNTLIEIIKQYHYDSEEERINHQSEMELNGYEDSGQIRDNIGTIMNPIYVWFGSYHKYEID